MPSVWISPGETWNATEGTGAITPHPDTPAVTIEGGIPILEGSVVAPHGSHTGTITINGSLGPSNVLIGGKRVAVATVDPSTGLVTSSSTASCGDGIAPGPPDPDPKTLTTKVTIG